MKFYENSEVQTTMKLVRSIAKAPSVNDLILRWILVYPFKFSISDVDGIDFWFISTYVKFASDWRGHSPIDLFQEQLDELYPIVWLFWLIVGTSEHLKIILWASSIDMGVMTKFFFRIVTKPKKGWSRPCVIEYVRILLDRALQLVLGTGLRANHRC